MLLELSLFQVFIGRHYSPTNSLKLTFFVDWNHSLPDHESNNDVVSLLFYNLPRLKPLKS